MDTQKRLQDKVAIVTGAGTSGPMPGTGQATAILLARQGARVLLVDLDAARAEQTRGTIEDEGGDAIVCEADVTRPEDCDAMVETCGERLGAPDVLVNNVGLKSNGFVTDVDDDAWQRTLDGNLKSAVMACRFAVPAMATSGGGSIINVSSIDGLRAGQFPNIPYTVAKGGLVSLTRAMAVHHGRQNIRVNCIAPGHLYAPFVACYSERDRELRRRAGPLGTEGDAWDVAWAAVFFASDESRWISGVVMPVDGGLLAATPLSVLQNLVDD